MNYCTCPIEDYRDVPERFCLVCNKYMRNTCNRHFDCEKAEKEYLDRKKDDPSYYSQFIPLDFHCYNEECEECFGN